jgi:hypothetical protein
MRLEWGLQFTGLLNVFEVMRLPVIYGLPEDSDQQRTDMTQAAMMSGNPQLRGRAGSSGHNGRLCQRSHAKRWRLKFRWSPPPWVECLNLSLMAKGGVQLI